MSVRHVNLVVSDQVVLAAPGFRVITEQKQLESVYQGARIREGVQLDKHILIFAHRGMCPTGGYAVKIQELRTKGHDLVVRIVTKDPGPNDFVTLVATYPTDVVALQKRSLGPPGLYRARFMQGDNEVAVIPFVI